MRPVLVAAAALALAGCAQLGASAILHPLRVPVVGEPAEAHRALEVRTADGLTLKGWLFAPAAPPRALVVLLHGKDINRQHFVAQAAAFQRHGDAVVAYDARAHGASGGEVITYGPREVEDLRRVLDAALGALGAPAGLPVFLVGESLGAAVALQAAAVEPRVKAVVAGAAFSDLQAIIEEHAPWYFSAEVRGEAVRRAEAAAGFSVAEVSPREACRRITVPVLLLHGGDDTFIPYAHSVRLLEALPGPRKRLVRLEGVGHVDVLLHRQAWEVIEAFLFELEATSSP